MIEIWIPSNVPSSKNSRVWTGKFFIASKAVQIWRRETQEDWDEHREYFLSAINDLELPLFIHMTFYRKSKHKFDYNNPCQTIMDEMTLRGWIDDDNADLVVPVFGKYIYSKTQPGVMIRLIKKPKYEFI